MFFSITYSKLREKPYWPIKTFLVKNEIRDSYWLLDVLSPILESTVKDLDKKELCHSSNRLEGKSKYQFHKPSNTKDQNFLYTI